MRTSVIRADCSRTVPNEIRKRPGLKRVYMMIENRSSFVIYFNYDHAASNDGHQGVEIPAGVKYELWGTFCPQNDTMFVTGSTVASQQVNYAEGYEDNLTDYEVRDHA